MEQEQEHRYMTKDPLSYRTQSSKNARCMLGVVTGINLCVGIAHEKEALLSSYLTDDGACHHYLADNDDCFYQDPN